MDDVVIVGGGHNGLVAAAYLARAGRRVLLLERLGRLGGLAVSARAFDGVDARLSRYSYLVSLLPARIVRELGLRVELRKRRFASYTPVGDRGLLVDGGDEARTRATFPGRDFDAWRDFAALTAGVARAVAPTLLEPLLDRAEFRRRLEPEAWRDLFERPIGEVVDERFADDTVRGVVLTDALIGTFADVDDPGLLANRCLLYHVIGNGTGDWDVPVGGMGAVTAALADAARAAGADLRTGTEVTGIVPAGARGGEVTFRDAAGAEHTVSARWILANLPPAALARLTGDEPEEPEGAQLKVNMVLARLPRLRDPGVRPAEAFGGTFHINEGRANLAAAHARASAGRIPDLPPAEVYCHSLTDPSILGPDLRAAGAHTLTLFGLHMPARLFRADPDGARDAALRATLASLDAVLAEPIADCLLRAPGGAPCVEAKTPVDLERETGLPGGHIFHRDLAWPFAEEEGEAGRWGVETAHPRLLLCGAGARRGGGVSGIPGRNAARAVLDGENVRK
ncbi:phytoene desaturase family protein [Actinomadura parmotrematis]|uniref:Pyridine nucleotide-disulfide oxidoreductase domain-containing protein 2 n=1 Tax=Actinomadura parmotrematis TaxID=2864039 RepID=A0ABS7FMS9_9ACTN|nr:FAD-dependent oxidoreductase [Actinomadura parmotrematis]MBW8481679.1 FAD-dependent oxidoreductase [Actinomadura parmotrematis]